MSLIVLCATSGVARETFRKTFKEENPGVKGVTASAKAGGEKWLQLSDEEKAPYISEAADRKAKYETAMATYKNGSTKVCISWPFRLSVDKFYYCCISSMLACQDCFMGFSTIVGTSGRHMGEHLTAL
jgi:hypothetical protein